ncbi:FAD-dependent monooxygenase [Streptomyces roseoverticillatus]|uniref:FAD-dependent oxidoreductase n=1 Tax=Streptomyces roseoverticillatus TaxID=66429 RepID=UPI001F2E1EE4|nr:NAD(P)/FAD-dependent oxidoreductase [Streptomyces roseoverticillatus]MCF3101765.1 FAD-dependent monooxygenase [Streptomyces roseoverticillatus]
MTSALSPIAVVGAGIGGLACARTLQQYGLPVAVFEREPSARSRPQGGMLDLHDTGQAALRAAGLVEEFHALARPEGQELRGLDPVTGELLHHELPADATVSAPEIDRGQLRGLLLDSLAPGTVRWGRPAASVSRVGDGTARLHFADGTSEDFALVVGADGAWSRIRPALSEATPAYTGRTLVETSLDDVDTRQPALAHLIGNGTLAAKSAGTMLLAQRNSGGHVRVYTGFEAPHDWHIRAGLDFEDSAAVREHLLGMLDGWHDGLLDLLRNSDGGFVERPQHVLPVGHAWTHVPGITLLGDAAHLMPPYGIGANLAMLDGTDLATAIATHDDLDQAVRAYENLILPRAAAAAQACADLTTSMTSDTVINVDAARQHLNEKIQEAQPAG